MIRSTTDIVLSMPLTSALVLAPLMDHLLDKAVAFFKLGSKRQAFFLFLTSCLGIAATIFSVTVFLWQ
jgi:hypothetical protein